jgi:hypothetical protein
VDAIVHEPLCIGADIIFSVGGAELLLRAFSEYLDFLISFESLDIM